MNSPRSNRRSLAAAAATTTQTQTRSPGSPLLGVGKNTISQRTLNQSDGGSDFDQYNGGTQSQASLGSSLTPNV